MSDSPSPAPSGHPLPEGEGNGSFWIAAERLHELRAAFADLQLHPPIAAVRSEVPDSNEALREIIRSRLELLGPVTAAQLAEPLGIDAADVDAALLQLEAEGAVIGGGFTAPGRAEWCDRRLLARIHRYTRDRKRAESRPVAPAQFMRFLFQWHQLAGSGAEKQREGEGGLVAVLQQLEGFAAPAGAWEEDLLPGRVDRYEASMLDRLCSAGRMVWQRPVDASEPSRRRSGPVRSTPIVLCEREFLPYWLQVADAQQDGERPISSRAQAVLEALQRCGASFFSDLVHETRLLRAELEDALGELVGSGLASCDSFAGLRALTMTTEKRERLRRRFGRHDGGFDEAGRWSLARARRLPEAGEGALADPQVEHIARVLLRRYGVVFRKLLERESGLPPWRDLHYVYRRLEARGEIRGGRFVSGFSGEQFALAEAVGALKHYVDAESRPADTAVERVCVSAADPLNLVGIITPGDKLARLPGNRVLFENGVPVAVQSGGELRYLKGVADARDQWEIQNLMIRRARPGSVMAPPGAAQ